MELRKTINVLTLIVMVSVNVFTPFSYAGIETGDLVDIEQPTVEEPVIEQSVVEQPVAEGPLDEKSEKGDDSDFMSGSIIDIEVPEEGEKSIEVVEPELPVVESGDTISMSGENNDIENEHGTSELSGGNNIEEEKVEEDNYNTGYLSKLNNLEKEHTLNLLHSLTSEEIRGEGSYDGVKVEVYAQTGAFPSGTILSIVPITGDNDIIDIQDVLKEQKDIERTEKLIAFDISFLDKETKEELQPSTGTVQVTFNYEDNEELKQAEEDETQEVKVYHLNDKDEEGKKIEEIKDVVVEEVVINGEESEDENMVVVEAESFSIYTIVTQVAVEGPNAIGNQLANFVYGEISIERPAILNSEDYPIEGFTIMDRNLGASNNIISTVNGTIASTGSYGYKYQWGNNYGFADGCWNTGSCEDSISSSAIFFNNSQAVYSESMNNSGYKGTTFIRDPDSILYGDYRQGNGHYNGLWGGESDINYSSNKNNNTKLYMDDGGDRILRQGPCPNGWHVPSIGEWSMLVYYWYNSGASEIKEPEMNQSHLYYFSDGEKAEQFMKYFKIPFAGMRTRTSELWLQGSDADLWSSTPVFSMQNYSYVFSLDNSEVSTRYSNSRNSGNPVRCFKNIYSGTGNVHTITFDFDGGSGSTALINVVSGEKAIEPSIPIKEGYKFDGWYRENTYENIFDFTGTVITSDIILYAKWSECEDCFINKLIFTYDANGGIFDNGKNIKKIKYDFIEGAKLIGKGYSHTPNINNDGIQNGNYANNLNTPAQVVTIPGASSLKITIKHGTESTNYDWVSMWVGSHPNYTAQSNYSTSIIGNGGKLGGTESTIATNIYEVEGDTVTFSFRSDSSSNYYGYYAIVEGLFDGYITTDSLDKPTRDGYYFAGWYESGSTTKDIFSQEILSEEFLVNKTLYAKRNEYYTVTFDTEGGNLKDSLVVPGGVAMVNAKFSHTPNVDDNGKQNGNYPTNYNTPVNTNDVVAIDGANRLKIKIIYGTYSSSYDRVSMWKGSHSDYTATSNYSTSLTNKLGGGYHTDNSNKKVYYVDGDTVTFSFVGKSYDSWGGDRYGYYAIIEDVEPNYDFGENPIKEGKVFDGWYKENGEKWDEYTDIVDGDITLYAHWKDPEAILLPGKEFNCQLKNLSENSNSTQCYSRSNYSINNIIRADSIPSGVKKVEIQSEDSNYSIYARYKNGTIYIYSEADIIYMNPDSRYMFYYMYTLKNLDIDAFDTSKVENMSYMFGYCYAIDNLDISNWNVENVESMDYMFYYAYGIKDLDLSKRKTNNLQNTSYMFSYAQSLKNLNLSGWDTSRVINMNSMFCYCTALESLILDGWDLSNNPSITYFFEGLNSLKFLSMRDWKIPTQLYNGLYDYNGLSLNDSYGLEKIDVTNWDLTNTKSLYQLFYQLYSVKEIVGLETWDTSNIESMYYTFAYLYNVENLDGVSNWNVSKVTDMYDMFYNCRAIEELDLSRWDTSKVQNMSSMFYNCNSLERLNLDNWSFESVGTSTSSMFYYASNLVELGMKNWKFGTNISYFACNMSLGCHRGYPYYNKIKEIDVSGWTFSGNSLRGLFYDWESLENIKGLETWDTSGIESMGSMFYHTNNLKSINLSGWNTSSVKDFGSMFGSTNNLKSINFSNWNTSSAKSMNSMFANSTGLIDLDLSSFDTSSVEDMQKMFYGSNNLKTIYVGDKFKTTSLLSGENMFSGTTSIVGGNGTVYDPLKFNQEYAKVDTLAQSGYFTNVLDKPYIITYNLDNGILSGEKTVYTQRDTFTLKNPIKTGYTFLGWTGSNGNIPQVEVNIQSGTIKGDLEYSANWKINQYTITFDTDGGNEISTIKLDYKSELINLPTPTKECNAFIGWKNLPENMPAHNITLKAMWNYTCSRSSGGGGGGNIKLEEDHGAAIQEPESEETKVIDDADNQEDEELQEIKGKDNDKSSNEIKENDDTKNNVSSEEVSHNDYTQEQKESYSFAKSNGITTTSSIKEAKMNTSLKRIEMAKMLSYYAINVLGQELDAEKGVVKFSDVTNKLDKEYDNGVTLAYQLGIMGQNMPNNKFRPNDEVTRAEFATALSRLLYGTQEGAYRATKKYYEPHIAKLYNEGIINNTDPKMKEKRGYVMTMLMRSASK